MVAILDITDVPTDIQSVLPRIYSGVPSSHVSPVYIIQGDDAHLLPPDFTHSEPDIEGYSWSVYRPHSFLLAVSLLKDAMGGGDNEEMCIDFCISILSTISNRRWRMPQSLILDWVQGYREYLEEHGKD